MEELHLLDEIKPTKKIYTKNGISLGAVLGGPIGLGYFLIENYKSFDKIALVKKAWGITIFSTLIYCFLAYYLKEVIGTTAIPLFVPCLGAARQIFKQEQASYVEAHIKNGGAIHSNWRVVGISFLCLVGTLTVLAIVVKLFGLEKPIVIPPQEELVTATVPARSTTSSRNNLMKSVVANLESKIYGEAEHEVVYNNFFFSELKIDSIAEELTAVNFFDAKNRKEVHLEKVLFDYEFSIIDASADLTNESTRLRYQQLRTQMEGFLKDGKVSILLMDENLEEVLARFDAET